MSRPRVSSRRRWPPVLALVLVLASTGPVWSQTIQNPRRLAEGPAGQLLVSDRAGSVVAVRKDNLEPVWSVQLPEEGAPFGLASRKRLLFVGNTETRNVEVYRMVGPPTNIRLRFQYNLGLTPPGETGSIERPIDIGFDSQTRLVFVLDGAAKQVKVFDRKGKLMDAFAPMDSVGDLLSPVSLAIDETRQEVLVGDYGDPSGFFRSRTPARILIYDYSGALLSQIDGDGTAHITTRFARVQGLTTSSDGRIFAADPLGGRILVLDRDTGALLAEVGSEGPEPGQLMLPLDVHFDEMTGDLFVSNNRGARRIEVFRAARRSR
jgi:outer membrane protein assembly factor BamB